MSNHVNSCKALVFVSMLVFPFCGEAGITDSQVNSNDMSLVSSENNIVKYTKLDIHGNELSDSAPAWDCVRDNSTGLVWEVGKDSGMHDKNQAYTWEESKDYAKRVNHDGLCGVANWRLPSKDELMTIVDKEQSTLKINTDYFPDTQNGFYWSSTPDSRHDNGAWLVYFSLGKEYVGNKHIDYYARAVSAGHEVSSISASHVVSNSQSIASNRP